MLNLFCNDIKLESSSIIIEANNINLSYAFSRDYKLKSIKTKNVFKYVIFLFMFENISFECYDDWKLLQICTNQIYINLV